MIFGCAGSVLLRGLSLVAARGGYSLVVVCKLLSVMASLVAEHGLQRTQASGAAVWGFSSCNLKALECKLSSYGAWAYLSRSCEIFPDQGLMLYPLHWQADSWSLSHQASPPISHSWLMVRLCHEKCFLVPFFLGFFTRLWYQIFKVLYILWIIAQWMRYNDLFSILYCD